MTVSHLQKFYLQTLKDIIIQKSYKYGNFTLASGAKTNYFFDLKPTMLDPVGINLISDLMIGKIHELGKFDAIGGMAVGAIPLISVIGSKIGVKAFFARKKAKDHGTEKTIEGELTIGDNVICVEDVTTTGGSVMIAVNAARASGAVVEYVITTVDRLEGASENLTKEGIQLISLFTREDFG